MGSGKTHFAHLLATNNNYNFIDLDTIIESNTGSSVAEIFNTKGEFFFREKETQALHSTVNVSYTKNIVATGGGTPCFNNNMHWMNENGITIWLNQSIENIVERTVGAKLQRPLIANIPNKNLFNFFTNQLQQRTEFYKQSKHSLTANDINENNLQKIINLYV